MTAPLSDVLSAAAAAATADAATATAAAAASEAAGSDASTGGFTSAHIRIATSNRKMQ